jgi:PKD repeat protein
LWYTDTTRTTWRYFSAGLPPTVNVSDLELYYEADEDCVNNTLYASTYNRGVWYSSTFHDGTQKPVAKVGSYDTVVCSSANVSLTDNSCNVPTEWLWEFSPNTVSFVQGDSSSENVVVSFASKGTYQFTHYAKNCNGYDSTIGTIIVGDTVKSACIPTTTNNFNSIGVFNFQMAGINRTSAGVGGEGEYVDVACTQVATVKEGDTYNVDVTTGVFNDEQVKIWIDYNNDGDFVDAGELVWSPAKARTNHSGSITIPNPAAVKGVILRMRVRTDFNAIANIPCGNVAYGQAEDYGLFIEPDSVQVKFVQSDTNLCAGETVVFTDSTTNGIGKIYSWSFGAGAIPATASSIGPHTVQYSSSGYKKVILFVGTDSLVKDSAIYVEQSPFMSINRLNNDSLLCAGESVQLQAVDANASGATLQWQFNEVDVVDSTFTHYYIDNSNNTDSGAYRVIANYNGCSDTSDATTIHVFEKPSANFTTNFDSSCFSNHLVSTTNTSSISDGSTLTYQWPLGKLQYPSLLKCYQYNYECCMQAI